MTLQTVAQLNGVRHDLDQLTKRVEQVAAMKPEAVQALYSEYSERLSTLYRRVEELERILRSISNKFDKLLDRV